MMHTSTDLEVTFNEAFFKARAYGCSVEAAEAYGDHYLTYFGDSLISHSIVLPGWAIEHCTALGNLK